MRAPPRHSFNYLECPIGFLELLLNNGISYVVDQTEHFTRKQLSFFLLNDHYFKWELLIVSKKERKINLLPAIHSVNIFARQT